MFLLLLFLLLHLLLLRLLLLLQMASSKLRDSFSMVLAQNSSILHWAMHQLITFFTTLKSHEVVQTGHWRTLASLETPFSKPVCMRTNHLVTKTIIIQDCWIRNTVVCMKTGRVFGIQSQLSVWTKPGQWFFGQYCIHLLEETYEDRLAALW